MAARIIQAIGGGKLTEILALLKNEKEQHSDEDFIEKIKQSQIVNSK